LSKTQNLEVLKAQEFYRPKERALPGKRWLLLSLSAVLGILVVMGLIIVYSIPMNHGTTAKLQAAACRENLRMIEKALSRYIKSEGESPPLGEINQRHPLVEYGYLPRAWRCPATKRYYVLKEGKQGVSVFCDSGKSGHSIK